MTQPAPNCWTIPVPRYIGANKKSTKKDLWCITHAKWNCKDGIIKV